MLRFVIGSEIESIGCRAFDRCRSLLDVDLYKVKEIGEMAFYGCRLFGLERIVPKSVHIEHGAFYGCHEENTKDHRSRSYRRRKQTIGMFRDGEILLIDLIKGFDNSLMTKADTDKSNSGLKFQDVYMQPLPLYDDMY